MMWIDFVIIIVSFCLFAFMRILYNKTDREYRFAVLQNNKLAAKVYSACRIAIIVFSLILAGVILYVYVFQ